MLLSLDSLSFAYRDTPVLRSVYCAVEAGQILAILGRNGSGKSTLFKVLMGILPCNSGVTKINGHYVPSAQRYRQIGWLPQDSFLPRELTVRAFLRLLPRRTGSVIDPAELPELRPLLKKTIARLATGERRLLEICVILNQDQPLLLLDEPFTGLQPDSIETVSHVLLRKASLGHGLIICDHQYSPVLKVCHQTALLHDGRLLPSGPGQTGESLLRQFYLPR